MKNYGKYKHVTVLKATTISDPKPKCMQPYPDFSRVAIDKIHQIEGSGSRVPRFALPHCECSSRGQSFSRC
jgi:hypothetical protein